MASGGGLAGRVQKGPYQPDDSLASMPAAPTAGALGEWVAKDVEIESAMEEMARRERARKRRADKVKVKAEEDQPGTASSLGSRGSSRRGGGGSAIQAHLSDDTGRVPSPVPLPAEVQRRLEQLWADLRMPVMEKLDMAVKYTAGDADHLVVSEGNDDAPGASRCIPTVPIAGWRVLRECRCGSAARCAAEVGAGG